MPVKKNWWTWNYYQFDDLCMECMDSLFESEASRLDNAAILTIARDVIGAVVIHENCDIYPQIQQMIRCFWEDAHEIAQIFEDPEFGIKNIRWIGNGRYAYEK